MPSTNKQPPDHKLIVRRFIDECWNHGKLNAVSELVAEKCRFHDPVFPSLTSGADNMRNHIESCRRGFPDLKFRIDDTIAERNEVVLHWTATGTHSGPFLGMQPTHRKATVSGTSIFRIEGNKIAEEWAYWNLMTMMEQLGVRMAPQVESSQGESQRTEAKMHAR